MADFLDELQEDIRHEHYLTLWKAYGPYIIGLVVLILVATASFLGWQSYQDHLHEQDSEAYHQALSLLKAGDTAQAVERFQHLEETSKGYGFLSRLQRMALQASAFVASPSPESLTRITQDTQAFLDRYQDGRHSALKGLMDLHVGLLMVQGNLSENGIQRTLEQQITPHNPWKGLNLEILFLQALQQKNTARASTLLSRVVGARDVSSVLQSRVGMMAMGAGLGIPPAYEGKK